MNNSKVQHQLPANYSFEELKEVVATNLNQSVFEVTLPGTGAY